MERECAGDSPAAEHALLPAVVQLQSVLQPQRP